MLAVFLLVLATGVSPASAGVVPSSLEFGDVPYGTAGTPVRTVEIQMGENRIKSIFQTPQFQIVSHTCEPWVTVSCSVSIAPFWPVPGGPGAGRETDMLLVTYTDGSDERIWASANFLPERPRPAPSSWFTVDDATITEGNTGTRVARFVVRRAGDRSAPASVKWSTLNGTAGAASDYVGVSLTTLNFVPGQASQTVSVTVNSDTVLETDETFTVKLSSPVGAEVSDNTGDDRGTGTIVDDDVPSYVSINDISVFEGDAGSRLAIFTVTRSGSLANPVSVKWATQDASASAGGDYTAVPGTTLGFAANENIKTVSVDVLGDGVDEGDETLLVRLSAPIDVLISDDAGTATIVDDDETYLAVNDVTVVEGDSGTSAVNFTVTRSGDISAPSSVNWSTLPGGSAAAASDYVAVPATSLDFAVNETTKTASVRSTATRSTKPTRRFPSGSPTRWQPSSPTTRPWRPSSTTTVPSPLGRRPTWPSATPRSSRDGEGPRWRRSRSPAPVTRRPPLR
ncbi:MAG: Calx-beta domain-containing protein [Acidimicrobiales bacterium]